jgi:hypothetical protein
VPLVSSGCESISFHGWLRKAYLRG